MKSSFHVSICGGGMGGLMLAVVMGKYGSHPVEIFEAGPTITTVGAGIGFFGRTMDVMKDLGLYDEFIEAALDPPHENTGPDFRISDQRDGYYWFSRALNRGQLNFHRKDVVDLLMRHVPATCKIHTSKKLNTYEVDSDAGKITLHFTDGSSTVTDVLVGADGIHSVTRGIMYKNLASSIEDEEARKKLLDLVNPVWTGILLYRNLVPTEKLLKNYPDLELPTDLMMHLGRNKHILLFPVSQGKLYNVVVFRHNCAPFGTPFEGRWATEVSEEEVLHHFEGWDARAQAIVKCIEKPSRWALHSLRSLPYYVDGKVALLGDSAHAMEPHFGAGAGQALEDAYVLGRLLTHESTHLGNVADALKTYEEVRLPFANDVTKWSRDVGRYYSLSVPPAGSDIIPPNDELGYVRKAIVDAWEWQSDADWVWGDAEQRWRDKCSVSART